MILLLGRVGLSNFYYFSDMSEDRYWDGETKITHGIRPMVYEPNWNLLHVATEDFPKSWGKNVQAMYLSNHRLTEGDHIEHFLEEYDIDNSELLSRLSEIENRLDRRLKVLGPDELQYRRNFQTKQDILNASWKEKMKMAVGNRFQRAYRKINRIFFDSTPFTGPPFHTEWHRRLLHREARWPYDTIVDRYRRAVEPNDFPDEHKPFWYEGTQSNYQSDSAGKED
jgi:hypothetical protein